MDSSVSAVKRRRSADSDSYSSHRASSANIYDGCGLGVTLFTLSDDGLKGTPGEGLVGSKNPDNDSIESTYRDAFQDCDTGEIYEGDVIYGTIRHGRGTDRIMSLARKLALRCCLS